MDELVDELSGTTIDEEPRKNDQQKCKNTKPVNRYASIINRSKLLILSDSESNDDEIFEKHCFSKYSRFSKQRHPSWKTKERSKIIPKRKRNSGSSLEVVGNSINLSLNESLINKVSNRKKNDPMMDIDYDESSSDLSDDCPTECNFDGDDEQSDFYDCTIKNRSRNHRHYYSHSKQKLEFKIPKPVNPFSVDFVETHSPNNHWKRRRAMH